MHFVRSSQSPPIAIVILMASYFPAELRDLKKGRVSRTESLLRNHQYSSISFHNGVRHFFFVRRQPDFLRGMALIKMTPKPRQDSIGLASLCQLKMLSKYLGHYYDVNTFLSAAILQIKYIHKILVTKCKYFVRNRLFSQKAAIVLIASTTKY